MGLVYEIGNVMEETIKGKKKKKEMKNRNKERNKKKNDTNACN